MNDRNIKKRTAKDLERNGILGDLRSTGDDKEKGFSLEGCRLCKAIPDALLATCDDSSIHQTPNFYLSLQPNPLLEAQTSFRASPPKKASFNLNPYLAPRTNAHYGPASDTTFAIEAATKSTSSRRAQQTNSLVPLDLERSDPNRPGPGDRDEMTGKSSPQKKY